MEITINNYVIVLSPEARNILTIHKQLHQADSESGGVILGKLVQNTIHILKLSLPTELDKASRFNFERHRLSAQIIIDYEFLNSNRQIIYLGEWHTHPEDIPMPSDTDIKMISQQFKKNKFHTDFLILLIQGREKLYIGIIDKTNIFYKLEVN